MGLYDGFDGRPDQERLDRHGGNRSRRERLGAPYVEARVLVVVPVALALFVMTGSRRGVVLALVMVLQVVVRFTRAVVLVGMHETRPRAGQAGQERQDGDRQTQ